MAVSSPTLTGSVASTAIARLVNGVLAIAPLANFAKRQARAMMIKRAATMGVYWQQESQNLRSRGEAIDFSPTWEADLAHFTQANLTYPDYYLTSFHAYEEGNLGWAPAMEVEVAAKTVHAKIWPEAGAAGDAKLRQSYHNILQAQLPQPPQRILDLGCSTGLSTFALQALYPEAHITGVDLSPYYLAVANYRSQPHNKPIQWVHAAAEDTGLAARSFDLVSLCLVAHELPATVTKAVLREAHRLLRPGGYFAFMDMNPHSEFLAKLPPYVLTLLKSTEPYLDQYFGLDLAQAFVEAGFEPPTTQFNSPRHRTLIARR
ncbi:MAG: class I SAM-dependent methyltransferase [Cyanobacteria bacterium J06639_14]